MRYLPRRPNDSFLDIKCAICASSSYSILYPPNLGVLDEKTFSARRVSNGCHYRVVKCRKCGLVFSNPVLAFDEIKRLYADSKFTYGSEVFDLKDTYTHYLERYLSCAHKRESFLEIGCGNGFFLEVALDLGFKNVYGVEASREAVASAPSRVRGMIRNEMFDPSTFTSVRFDVICFFQTIDHVLDPNQFLSGCYSLLSNGGIVLCICHNIESLLAKVLGERCPMIDVEHIYLFSKSTLRRIFEKNGFDVIDVFDVYNRFSLEYWVRMCPFPTLLKRRVTNLLRTFGIEKWKLKLNAGNIGMVASK